MCLDMPATTFKSLSKLTVCLDVSRSSLDSSICLALACLFLAGKVEDNPKKIYDVVIQFHKEVPKREKLVDPELSDIHVRQLKVNSPPCTPIKVIIIRE